MLSIKNYVFDTVWLCRKHMRAGTKQQWMGDRDNFCKIQKAPLDLKGLRSTQHWVGAEKQLCLGLPGLDMPPCLTHSPPALVLLFPESKREAIMCGCKQRWHRPRRWRETKTFRWWTSQRRTWGLVEYGTSSDWPRWSFLLPLGL